MEYSTIFGQINWNTIRRGKFQGKHGNFMSIARVIYNGLSYNFGSQDGAVTIMEDFAVWRFIAPVDRFVMEDYAEMTLHEALDEIIKETEAVPVPAWDEFFSFLGGKEDEANAAILGHDVMRIHGVKVELPMIENCSDFVSFMRWLGGNVGEAGNLPAEDFIEGQDMVIPLAMYTATPISLTLKTPTRKPAEENIALLGDFAHYTTLNGNFAQPVFIVVLDGYAFLYAYEETTDSFGTAVPQGWSAIAEGEDGSFVYTPHDMDGNPVTIPFAYGEGIEVNWQAKLFMNIEYDESTEVHDGTINFLFRA